MKGPTDKSTEIKISPIPGCRLSYTLNNYQPVRCSFIGDEPLFFLDVEDPSDDAGLFDENMMEDLSLEITQMEHKISAYDKISAQFHTEATQVTSLFGDNASDVCEPAATHGTDNMDEFAESLKQSRYLDSLLTFAKHQGVDMKWSAFTETVDYDRNGSVLLINPNIDASYRVLAVARELRRVWQHKSGVLIDPTAFYPDQGILINRIQEADLSVSMIRAAWELQLSGSKEAWTAVENSSFCDLGRAFAREACNDFRSINNGQAALGVIEAWFLSERCRNMDRKYIQRMLAGTVSKSFNQSEAVSRQAAATLIYALGETPFGKNYLASHAQYIMNDPIFCEVRDRANANFLWFIKFENSFSEAEQSLQKKEAVTHGSQNDKTSKAYSGYTQENETTVIAFPRSDSGSQDHSAKIAASGKNDCGTILPFGQF